MSIVETRTRETERGSSSKIGKKRKRQARKDGVSVNFFFFIFINFKIFNFLPVF